MTKCFIHLIGLPLFFLVACRTNKNLHSNTTIKPEDIVLLAWNEDTVHDYRFVLTRGNHFAYKTIMNDTTKVERNYHGNFSCSLSSDTIFLTYDNNIRPVTATDYLIKEASGRYLIQSFQNTSKRIFLRIQNLTTR